MAYAPDGGTLAYVITPGKTAFNFFSHAADFIIQFLSGNQIVCVHIHIFLPGFLQLCKLGIQLFFIVQVFVLCLINPLEFSDHITDHILLCF